VWELHLGMVFRRRVMVDAEMRVAVFCMTVFFVENWVLYSIYWVFWGRVQKKEVKKEETMAISL